MLIKRGDAKIINIVKDEEDIDELLETKKALNKAKNSIKSADGKEVKEVTAPVSTEN